MGRLSMGQFVHGTVRPWDSSSMGQFVHGTVRPWDSSSKGRIVLERPFGDILYSVGNSLKARSVRNASNGEVQKVHGTLINKRSALYVLAESVSDR
jgi:hypothetical protein